MHRDRLQSIDALRGLAALIVAWFHLTNGYDWDWVRYSGTWGWLGVDVFFVISGFVIPFSMLRHPEPFTKFMARRLKRIEPPYVASVLVTALLLWASSKAPGFAGKAPDFDPLWLLSHLFYLIPLTHFSWINPVYWSLAYEFVFYILVALTFGPLWKLPLWVSAAFNAAVAALAFAITGQFDPRIVLFLVGYATLRSYVGRDSAKWPPFAVCAAIAFLGSWASGFAAAATAAVILWNVIPKLRPLQWLGAISYSLYLLHVPIGGRVVNLGRRFGSGTAFELALSLVALAVSLAAAFVLYRLIERPATAWSRKKAAHVVEEQS